MLFVALFEVLVTAQRFESSFTSRLSFWQDENTITDNIVDKNKICFFRLKGFLKLKIESSGRCAVMFFLIILRCF
jgi:hypothetical protein